MENSTTPQDDAAMSPASAGSVRVLAWGVMPGDNLPLWRCSSKRQAEAVVVWLRTQRPASTPQAVPLVDGRHSPTLTDAEREAVEQAATVADDACEEAKRWVGVPRWANGGVDDSAWQAVADRNAARAATLRGLLERLGGER